MPGAPARVGCGPRRSPGRTGGRPVGAPCMGAPGRGRWKIGLPRSGIPPRAGAPVAAAGRGTIGGGGGAVYTGRGPVCGTIRRRCVPPIGWPGRTEGAEGRGVTWSGDITDPGRTDRRRKASRGRRNGRSRGNRRGRRRCLSGNFRRRCLSGNFSFRLGNLVFDDRLRRLGRCGGLWLSNRRRRLRRNEDRSRRTSHGLRRNESRSRLGLSRSNRRSSARN